MECVPDGWCSQDFRIRTGDREGKVSFATTPPFGAINDGIKDYSIELAGKINRRWELTDAEAVVLTATKKLGFKRVVKFKAGKTIYTLSRKQGSDAMILEGDLTSACFQRIHPFTRRHKITGEWSSDCLVIFAFWFVAYYDQIDTAIAEIVNGAIELATLNR